MGIDVEVIGMNDRPVDLWALREASHEIGMDFEPWDRNGRVPDQVLANRAVELRLPVIPGRLTLSVSEEDEETLEHMDEIVADMLRGSRRSGSATSPSAQRRMRRGVLFGSTAGRSYREIELMVFLAATHADEVEGYLTTVTGLPGLLQPSRAYGFRGPGCPRTVVAER